MPFPGLARQQPGVDPPAVVAHAQADLPVVIADLDLDALGLRMPEAGASAAIL